MNKFIELFESFEDDNVGKIYEYLKSIRNDLKNFIPSLSAEKVEKILEVENLELQSGWSVSVIFKFPVWKKNFRTWEETDNYKYHQIFINWAKQFEWCGEIEPGRSNFIFPLDNSLLVEIELNDCQDVIEFCIRIE